MISQTRGEADASQAGWRPARTLWIGAILLLLLAALAVRGYMMKESVNNIPVTADESITVLQAKQIRAGEFPLLVLAQPYQFPLEAYLSAPLVSLVPRTTWGARYLSFAEGFLGLLLLLLLVRRLGPWRQHWPVALLILFPSAYLLTIQFAYSLPHNTPVYLCGWGALLLVFAPASSRIGPRLLRLFLAGALCGLAFANNMVALPLVTPILIAALFQGRWRHILPNGIALALGATLGLTPYLAALWLQPGAHGSVAGTRTLTTALTYLWQPAVTVTLTRALGITPTLFPDTRECLAFGSWLLPIFPFIAAALGVAATALSAIRIVRTLIQDSVVRLNLYDVAVGTLWLSLAVFILSNRGFSNCYRYLVPAAWSFPFLVGAVYAASPRILRVLLGAGCALYAVLNVMTVVKLTEAWRQPDFAEHSMDAPDLKPALDFLRQQGIARCVTGHWQAYRINFYTDEAILCSQPFNERFADWPIPYRDQVSAHTNVAVLLSKPNFVEPAEFEAQLQALRIKANKSIQGAFTVYYGFTREKSGGMEVRVPPEHLSVTTSHNNADARKLVDTRVEFWTSLQPQVPGMWIHIALKEPRRLSRIVLIYDSSYSFCSAPVITVHSVSSDNRQPVTTNLVATLDHFELVNNQPVYGEHLQTLHFPPVYTDWLRFETRDVHPNDWWTLRQIELYALEPELAAAPVMRQNSDRRP